MNHFEQLASEWLQYRGYFVRTAVAVGPRAKGGYEGELDVVGFCPPSGHFIHIECSLDALSWADRERRFAAKFERGRRFAHQLFASMSVPDAIDQVALLQFSSEARKEVGGARIVTGINLIHEIMRALQDTSPASGAVPATFPLVRTLQLAAAAQKTSDSGASLIRHAHHI